MFSAHNFRVVVNSMRLCHWSQFNKEEVHVSSNWLSGKMGGALNWPSAFMIPRFH